MSKESRQRTFCGKTAMDRLNVACQSSRQMQQSLKMVAPPPAPPRRRAGGAVPPSAGAGAGHAGAGAGRARGRAGAPEPGVLASSARGGGARGAGPASERLRTQPANSRRTSGGGGGRLRAVNDAVRLRRATTSSSNWHSRRCSVSMLHDMAKAIRARRERECGLGVNSVVRHFDSAVQFANSILATPRVSCVSCDQRRRCREVCEQR